MHAGPLTQAFARPASLTYLTTPIAAAAPRKESNSHRWRDSMRSSSMLGEDGVSHEDMGRDRVHVPADVLALPGRMIVAGLAPSPLRFNASLLNATLELASSRTFVMARFAETIVVPTRSPRNVMVPHGEMQGDEQVNGTWPARYLDLMSCRCGAA